MSGYYTDPRERNYSARTLDEMAYFIIEDPKAIIKRIYKANSLPKWQRHPEWFDEFRQGLALQLIDKSLPKKFSGQTDLLLEWFNGSDVHSFSRWLVVYTRNQMKSATSPFADVHSERAVSIDRPLFDTCGTDATDIHRELAVHDIEFDFDHIRNLRSTDLDVLLFLLDADKLRNRKRWRDEKGRTIVNRKLTEEEVGIYRRYLNAIAQAGQRMTLKDFAHQIGECPKLVAKVVPLVGRCLKRRAQELDDL